MPLPTGKVSPYELVKLVFPHLKLDDDRILVGPELGLDAAVIELPDRVLVLSSDPITGALQDPAWLSVHVNANDVATMGATPQWYLANFFLPEEAGKRVVEELTKRASVACEELGISLVGGHTEVTPGLDRALISGAIIGEAPKDRWVSAGGAKPGDRIILTKGVAIEGTFILASDREEELVEALGRELVERAKEFKQKLSVVKGALTAIESGGVNAMHDPTEGGLAGGLCELADASGVGFKISRDSIPIAEETQAICNYLEIDPLRTISSGSLLICVHSEEVGEVLNSLEEEGIKASEIGEVIEDEDTRLLDDESLEFPEQDELWRVFKH